MAGRTLDRQQQEAFWEQLSTNLADGMTPESAFGSAVVQCELGADAFTRWMGQPRSLALLESVALLRTYLGMTGQLPAAGRPADSLDERLTALGMDPDRRASAIEFRRRQAYRWDERNRKIAERTVGRPRDANGRFLPKQNDRPSSP